MERLKETQYTKYSKPKYEVADVFRDNTHKLTGISYPQWLVVNAILRCRTKKMGGHSLFCPNCGYKEISYNSCRNRHCPKCQTMKKIKWLQDRFTEILPIKYFHIVFTLPSQLNRIVLQNKKELYDILFKSAKETLEEAALNPKNLGAKIGFIAVLHTWGQNLMDHPHLHCVVTGGGLSKDKTKWISSRDDYFISVKLLGKLFRGKYLYYLNELYKGKKLSFHGKLSKYKEGAHFQRLLSECYSKDWVVYTKKPFSNPAAVFQYLGRYTHRVAISNHRIINISREDVSFLWKDYKEPDKKKIMTVSIDEFMRRFLLHVLPKGFQRIRFYGIFSNRYKKENIALIKRMLNCEGNPQEELFYKIPINIDYRKYKDITECPRCHNPHIQIIEIPVEKINKSLINTS